jgi:hypothetical protein
MFQTNVTITPGALVTIISLVIAAVSVAFNILQFKMRQRDKRRRYLSERVYEPLLNEISAATRAKIWGHSITKKWIEESDAAVGALLKLDDPALFQGIDEFYKKIHEFEVLHEQYLAEKEQFNEDLFNSVRKQVCPNYK